MVDPALLISYQARVFKINTGRKDKVAAFHPSLFVFLFFFFFNFKNQKRPTTLLVLKNKLAMFLT